MKYIDVMKYCLSLPNSQRRAITPAGNKFALLAGESVFGYFETGAPIQWQFSLPVSAQRFDNLLNPPQVRHADTSHEQFPWRQKPDLQHENWITIQRVENFDEVLLKELIDWSYRQATA